SKELVQIPLAAPPIAVERVEPLADGRLLYSFKRPWRDGTHIVMERLDCRNRCLHNAEEPDAGKSARRSWEGRMATLGSILPTRPLEWPSTLLLTKTPRESLEPACTKSAWIAHRRILFAADQAETPLAIKIEFEPSKFTPPSWMAGHSVDGLIDR